MVYIWLSILICYCLVHLVDLQITSSIAFAMQRSGVRSSSTPPFLFNNLQLFYFHSCVRVVGFWQVFPKVQPLHALFLFLARNDEHSVNRRYPTVLP